MTTGTRVVRVSLRSDEGKEGERGIIRRVYSDETQQVQCYAVEWDESQNFKTRMAIVAHWRVTDLATWQAKQKEFKADEVSR